MKKGVSLIVVIITIIVMIILTGVVIMNITNVFSGADLSKLKSDVSQLEALMSIYKTRKSGFIDFDTVQFDTSSLNYGELDQFKDEQIENDKIKLYIIDLDKIDAESVNFGNLERGSTDRYLYSLTTGNVYYEKGLVSDGIMYYGIYNTTLATDYVVLEYIESTGTQYIDTGFYPSNNTNIKVDYQFTSINTQQRVCSANTSSYFFDIYINDFGYFSYNAGTSRTNTASSILADTSRHIFEINVSKFKIDGTQVASLTETTGTSNYSLLLLARRVNDVISYSDYPTDAKLYGCKIYDNDVLVRDFIPCYRKADNIIGLYDRVEGKFYTNQGAGTFKTKIPSEYQEIEYIESTGTQYIDTGIKGNLNTAYEVSFMSTQGTQMGVVFGARISATSANISTICPADLSQDKYNVINDFGDYNYTRQTMQNTAINTRFTAYNSKNLRRIYNYSTNTIDKSITEYCTNFTTLNNLYIAYKSEGYVSSFYNFIGKIYYVKIWDNSTLVRDFVPCYRKSDLVVGLFDKVNNVFYTNSGTGTFVKGPDV